MKTVLLCPSERAGVSLVGRAVPLVLAPMLGQSLVEYWLSHLACREVREVDLLVHDRPELIQALVGGGDRWGMKVQVISETRELTTAQVLLKYEQEKLSLHDGVESLDHFPGFPEQNLFESFGTWFTGLSDWIPHALMPDRVGVHELRPGIWTGLHSLISPGARIHAPCWIGRNVLIRQGAVIGPNAIIEDGSIIEAAAAIANSQVGPHTFVGAAVELNDSLAWGCDLVNWKTGSSTQVPDAFVLCGLRQARVTMAGGWVERLKELCSSGKPEEDEMIFKHFLFNKEG